MEQQQQDPLIFQKQNNLKNIRILSIGFLLLFASFGTAQNMASSFYEQLDYTNLGRYMLFVVYFVFAIVSLFAPTIVENQSPNKSLFYASLSYTLFVLFGYGITFCSEEKYKNTLVCQEQTIYFVGMVVAFFNGVGAGILWVVQGQYVDLQVQDQPENRNYYISIFWSFFFAYSILGNSLSYILFGFNSNITYLVLFIIGLLANIMFLLLPETKQKVQQKISQSQRLQQQKQKLMQVYRLLQVTEVQKLLPLMWSIGTCFSFTIALVGKFVNLTYEYDLNLYNNKSFINQQISFVFLLTGISGLLTGKFVSRLIDKYEIYKLMKYGTFISIFNLLTCLLLLQVKWYILCLVQGILWGFLNCYVNQVFQNICTKYYPQIIEIYCIFRALMALGIGVAFLLTIVVPLEQYLLYSFIVQFIAAYFISKSQTPGLVQFLKGYNNNNDNLDFEPNRKTSIDLEMSLLSN